MKTLAIKGQEISKVYNAELAQTQQIENITPEQDLSLRSQIAKIEIQLEKRGLTYRQVGDLGQKINILCKELGEAYIPAYIQSGGTSGRLT